MDISEYFKLLDEKHLNTVVRANGSMQYVYDKEKKAWVRSGIMINYFCDESDCYNMFEEIPENEALNLTGGW